MAPIWIPIIPKWSEWNKHFEYLSDPSRDLVERFRDEIVKYENPAEHSAYVDCEHPQKSKGYLLFNFDRAEIFVKPDETSKKLYFIDCWDNN